MTIRRIAAKLPLLDWDAANLAAHAIEARDALWETISDLDAEGHIHIMDGGDPDEVTPTEGLGLVADALDALAAALGVFRQHVAAFPDDIIEAHL